MNLFEKIFKKNKPSNNNLSLINIKENIIMPPEEFFNKNKDMINKYYEEYKTILNSNKTILSIGLMDNNQDDYRVYIDILASLEIHIHSILDDSNIDEYNYEYITNILARLNTYSDILKTLEDESFLRLKALYKLKKIILFNQNKKTASENEISRLEIQVFTLQKIIDSIKIQINSCLTIMDIKNLKSDFMFITKLHANLINYLLAYNHYESLNNNVTYNQIFLEKQLFKNKNVLEDLKDEYTLLTKENNLTRNDRIHRIERLIDKYMSIKDYKRITNNELFKNLIEYKIDSYKIDYFSYQEILSRSASYPEETKMMEEIFMEKVNTFMRSEEIINKYTKYLTRLEYNKLARLIKDTIKTNNNYNYKRILISPELTALIFSIESPNELYNYFKNYLVTENTYMSLTNEIRNMFSFNYRIPLETIMRFSEIMLNNYHSNILIKRDFELYSLYQIYNFLKNKLFSEMPNNYIYDGVEKIVINKDTIIEYKDIIINYNRELEKGNKLICPDSLKSIEIYEYDYPKLISFDFALNDNIEELIILSKPLRDMSSSKLTIPPSLKYLKLSYNPKKIIMKDYLNSYLLKDPEAIKNFFILIGNMQVKNTDNKIETILFQGKSTADSFEMDVSTLDNRVTNLDTIYKVFNSKLRKAYENLLIVANTMGYNYKYKSPSINSTKELENKIYIKCIRN